MVEEKIILQVLSEQRDEKNSFDAASWVARMEESLLELDSPLAQIVIGVRRSGKSTLCHKVLIEHNINYAYANFDDDRLASMKTEDLNTLLSCIYQIYGTDIKYLFLDEIQNVEGWHLFVNRLLRNKIRIIATGSNAKLLSSELATHLTGRYNEIRLFPFSFSEYCHFHHIDIKSITTKAAAERQQAFAQYMIDGGFPELQSLNNKRGYVQSLIEAILIKDIQYRYQVRSTDALRKIAHHLISNSCQLVNYGELASLLGVSDKTVKKYVDYLQQAFLIQLLTKHSFKSRQRIHNEKTYIVDIGIQNNRENSMAAENMGWRLENIVFIELMRRCAPQFLDIYYYKPTSRAKEVDFVICNQSKAIELIQVAFDISSPKTYQRETSSLIKASRELKCDKLTLISFNDTRDVNIDGKIINICSALDWLLK
jgi:predicted AAA+ superfamily ATPase